MLATSAPLARNEIETFADDMDGGIYRKIQLMRDFAAGDLTDPEMQDHWIRAMREAGAGERRYIQEIGAWFWYLKRHARYTPASILFTQVILRPAIFLRREFGDCVAFATAGAAGLGIAGYDSEFVFASTRQDRKPSHVYLNVWYPPRTHEVSIVFDASAPHSLGWEYPKSGFTWILRVPVFGKWSPPGAAGIGDPMRVRDGRIVQFGRSSWQPQWHRNILMTSLPTREAPLPPYEDNARDLPAIDAGRNPEGTFNSLYGDGYGYARPPLLLTPGVTPASVGDPLVITGVGGWFSNLTTAVKKVVAPIQHAATVNLQTLQHSTTVNLQTLQKDVSKIEHAATVNLQNLRNEAASAVNKLKAEGARAWAAAKKALNKLTPSPLHRVLLYLAGGPVGMYAAYVYTKKHQYEVMQELPASVRNTLKNLETELHNLFDGKSSQLSGIGDPRVFVGFGNPIMGGIGGGEWDKIRSKIAQEWDHLPHARKNEIIAAIVLLTIITVIVIIYASPALSTWLKAKWEILSTAFKSFFGKFTMSQIYTPLVGMIMRLFKKGAGPSIPANLPNDPIPDPSPSSAEMAAAAAEVGNSDPSEAIHPVAKAAISFGISAAFAALGKAVGGGR